MTTSGLSGLDERMARLEGAYEQITLRLARLEDRFDRGLQEVRTELREQLSGVRSELGEHAKGMRGELAEQVGGLRSELGEVRRETRNQFYWLLGLLFPMWITIVVAVVLRV